LVEGVRSGMETTEAVAVAYRLRTEFSLHLREGIREVDATFFISSWDLVL